MLMMAIKKLSRHTHFIFSTLVTPEKNSIFTLALILTFSNPRVCRLFRETWDHLDNLTLILTIYRILTLNHLHKDIWLSDQLQILEISPRHTYINFGRSRNLLSQ